MIKCNVSVIGTVSRTAQMRTNKEGKSFLSFGVNVVIPETAKRMVMTFGSCICFVCLATSLPHFFGMDGKAMGSNILLADGSIGNNDFLSSNTGGIPLSGIDTSIPPLSDGSWVTFPPGTNMDIARSLVDIYNNMGGGAEGSYGRTLDYINLTYQNGDMDRDTYQKMLAMSGVLPHH